MLHHKNAIILFHLNFIFRGGGGGGGGQSLSTIKK